MTTPYTWHDTYHVGAGNPDGPQRLAAPYTSGCAGHLGKAVLVTGLLQIPAVVTDGASTGEMAHLLSRLSGSVLAPRDVHSSIKLWVEDSFVPYGLFESVSDSPRPRYRPTPAGEEVFALNGLMLSVALSKHLAAPVLGKTARQPGRPNPHQLRIDLLRMLDLSGEGERSGRFSTIVETLPMSKQQITDSLDLFGRLGYLEFVRNDLYTQYTVTPMEPKSSYAPLRRMVESYVSGEQSVTRAKVMEALRERVMRLEKCSRKTADCKIARTMVTMGQTGRLRPMTGMKNTDTFIYSPNPRTSKGVLELIRGIDAFEAASPAFRQEYAQKATRLVSRPKNVQRALRAMNIRIDNGSIGKEKVSIEDEVFTLLERHTELGSSLTTKEIVKELGHSRTPVRAALKQLEESGAVIARNHAGAARYRTCDVETARALRHAS